MNEDIKLLSHLAPSTTTLTDLYTLSADAAVAKVVVCNRTGGALTFRLTVAPGGAVDATSHYVRYDKSVPANDSVEVTGLTLSNTDVIRCRTSAANDLTFQVWGTELTTSLVDVTAGGVLSGSYPSPEFDDLSCIQSLARRKTFYLMFNGGGGTRAVGCNASVTAGGGTYENNDGEAIYTQYNTSASANAVASVSGGAYDEIRTKFNPKLYCGFRITTDSTAERLWIGIFNTSFSATDTAVGVGSCIALRGSTTVPDTNFQIVCGTSAAQTVVDTGILFDLNEHSLKLEVTGNGTSLTWTLDAATGTVTTNLPATTTNMGYQAVLTTTTAATRRLRLTGLEVEQEY